jgi:hypothetical protein
MTASMCGVAPGSSSVTIAPNRPNMRVVQFTTSFQRSSPGRKGGISIVPPMMLE